MAGLSGKLGAVFKNYSSNDKSKLIADFQNDESWTQQLGVQSNDTTNFRLGTKSIRITEDDATPNFIYSVLNSISLDLTQFESGAASDTSDYIYIIFYVSDSAGVSDIRLSISPDATYDGSDKYEIVIDTFVTGWNYVKVKKSAFASTGTPSWSGVQSLSVGWTTVTIGTYVSFQALYLIDDSYDLCLANNTAYTMEQVGLFYNWGVDFNVDMLDKTTFDSAGWKEFLPSLKGFDVSAEKYWANGDNLTNAGAEFALILYVNTTNGYRYEGLAKLSSDNVETGKEDLVNESIEFTGSGELYYTDLQIIDS